CVRPQAPLDDCVYGWMADAHVGGYCLLRHAAHAPHVADALDVRGVEFRGLVALASHGCRTSLAIAVRDVLELRAEEQVLRVHARPNVAAMQDAHAFWDRTVRALPCEAVSTHTPDLAVAAIAKRAAPQMARRLQRPRMGPPVIVEPFGNRSPTARLSVPAPLLVVHGAKTFRARRPRTTFG